MTNSKISSAISIMIKTDRMHKQLIDSAVSSMGLHRTHHMILMHVSKNNRLKSQKILADHIGVTQAAITGALKKLEKDGYICRVQGEDNRYNEIELTETGKKVVEKTRALFSNVDTSLFEGFSDDELDGYIAYLEKIQKNINAKYNIKEGGVKLNEKMV